MPNSMMRIPNALNSRLMATRRIRPFRRGGGPYTYNGYSPFSIFDPLRDNYGGVPFEDMVTHDAITAPATMYDSAGRLVWNTHNRLLQSVDISATGWTTQDLTVLGGQPDPTGGNKAMQLTQTADWTSTSCRFYQSPTGAGVIRIAGKAGTGGLITIRGDGGNNGNIYTEYDLSNGTKNDVGLTSSTSDILPMGGGWYLCEMRVVGEFSFVYYSVKNNTGDTVLIYAPHAYDSSLDMADNPDQTVIGLEKYVETTTAAVYLPRRNDHRYDGTQVVPNGLRWEPVQATNLLSESNDLTTWETTTAGSLTVTANSGVGPSGSTDLDKIEVTDTANEVHAIQTIGLLGGATSVGAIYVRYDSSQRYVGLRSYGGLSNYFTTVVFDLQTGVVTQASEGSLDGTIDDKGIIQVGTDLYRIWVQSTFSTGTADRITLGFYSSGTPTLDTFGTEQYVGAGGEYIYAGYADMTAGAGLSSHIPTRGSTVTRPAETGLAINDAYLPQGANPSSVVFRARVDYADNDNYARLYQRRRTATATLGSHLSWETTRTGTIVSETYGDVYRNIIQDEVVSPGVGREINLAARHATVTQNAVNGSVSAESATVTTLPDLATANMTLLQGYDGIGVNGNIHQVLPYDADIEQKGLEEAITISTDDPYTVGFGWFRPPLVADMAGVKNPQPYYRALDANSGFDTIFDPTITAPSTMYDSTGKLVWGLHNLIRYSEQLDSWTKNDATVNADNSTGLGGSFDEVVEGSATGLHQIYAPTISFDGGAKVSVSIVARLGNTSLASRLLGILPLNGSGYGNTQAGVFNLSTGVFEGATTGTGTSLTGEITDLGGGIYICTATVDGSVDNLSGVGAPTIRLFSDATTGSYAGDGTSSIEVRAVWAWRSDLDMADNPDPIAVGLENYVPTDTGAVHLPRRYAYRFVDGSPVLGGTLIEGVEAAQLVTQTNDFETTWTKRVSGDTITAAAATGPDDKLSMTLYAPDATSDFHAIRYAHTFTNLTYTASGYFRSSGRRYIHFTYGGDNFGLPTYEHRRGIFDLVDGVVHSEPIDGKARLKHIGGDIYFGTVTITSAKTNFGAWLDIYHADENDPTNIATVSGDGVNGIHIYGVNLVAAAEASSYTPANGNTVTRPADTINMNYAAHGLSDTPFSVATDIIRTGGNGFANYEYIVNLWDGTGLVTNSIQPSGKVRIAKGGNLADTPNAVSEDYGTNIVSAFWMTQADMQVAEGGAASVVAPGPVAYNYSTTDMNVMQYHTGAYGMNGFLRMIRVWPEKVGQIGIEEGSTP